MSKLSEEEIKEIIKDFLELREIHSSDSARKSYLSIYQEAIQGLLDLYKQEKEKNKKIKNHIKAELKTIAKCRNEVGFITNQQYDAMEATYKCILNLFYGGVVDE